MNEQEIRALVRDVIAHRLERAPAAPAPIRPLDASHAQFALPSGMDRDGPCLIEPGVLCTHCGYCRSYGH